MELISPLLRVDFREFCVNYLVLRQINDIFMMAGIKAGSISANLVSGQRRTLVEEYYSTLNWHNPDDIEKFLKVLGYAIAQQYSSQEPREKLKALCEREGLTVDGIQIRFKTDRIESAKQSTANPIILDGLKQKLLALNNPNPQKRGFEFERFLKGLFEAYGLEPRGSFRLVGEQIDGSFELAGVVYLVEAKWQEKQTAQNDLLVFREKVESKSSWTRGLFVSNSGFTEDGITAFSRGRATNIVGMTGQDLFFVLCGEMSLTDAIKLKARRAAETGEFYVSVFDLLRNQT